MPVGRGRRYVFGFAEGDKDQKDLLGGKGANLAEMVKLGLPVPPGFTISTEACRTYLATGRAPEGLDAEIVEHLAAVEAARGKKLGDPGDPLLVSVRSGAKFSMPGMMETVLNIGLNDQSVHGLAAQSDNPRFAWDSYRRLIQMFGKTVLDIEGERFEHALDELKADKGVVGDLDLDANDLQGLVGTFKRIVAEATGQEFPQEPRRAAHTGDQRGVLVVELRARGALPAPGANPQRSRHGGERGGDGVRQHRPGLRDRRLLHPRPGDRSAGRVRGLPAERPG